MTAKLDRLIRLSPVKQACDARSMAKAFNFRKVTTENGLY
jgi:hypothetical protein